MTRDKHGRMTEMTGFLTFSWIQYSAFQDFSNHADGRTPLCFSIQHLPRRGLVGGYKREIKVKQKFLHSSVARGECLGLSWAFPTCVRGIRDIPNSLLEPG